MLESRNFMTAKKKLPISFHTNYFVKNTKIDQKGTISPL